jgi:predicted transcriptional regulator
MSRKSTKEAKTKMLFLRATPELRRKIEETAAAKDRPMSWLIEYYVKLGLSIEENQLKEAR